MQTRVKTDAEIAAMRESGRMLATVLQVLRAYAQAGMSTKDLADKAAHELKALGGDPAFLGYQGFPDVLCVSLNDEVVHGIPNPRRIVKDGDILSMDFGVVYRGMTTDGAISCIVGKPLKPAHQKLLEATERSMMAGIGAVHDGVRTGDIGAAVQAVLDKHRYGIVRDLVGHGVGHYLHEDPNVPNYGRPHTGPWLEKGMTIAIEPMATLGTDQVYVADDGWTILTQDGSWAAHFEHTVLITEDGAQILTQV
ncbi:MAG TPA: type I methionyl aminopeptidase [Candidatus Saccharimonadales bacterium]|nr:type I methionyl aminopeptidase [Candidatus Saccharimonadales bacterium]